MSAGPQVPSQPVPPSAAHAPDNLNKITIVSHSNLVYWWPVWAVGFIMALLTYLDGHRMAVVPEGSFALHNVSVAAGSNDPKGNKIEENRSILVLPKGKDFASSSDPTKLHMSRSKNYGVLFATVLLAVIFITNVPMRGGWSFAVIVFAILLAIILALAELWEKILEHLSYLDIRINIGGYLFISSILFVLWLVTLLVFDRRIYTEFTPSQFTVNTEIGGGEHVYPTGGMVLEKQRSDLFRHWVLGLGSGDLIIRTNTAPVHEFNLQNVLFIGKKVKQIQSLLKKQVVVQA